MSGFETRLEALGAPLPVDAKHDLPMTGEDRFALLALLDEMRVFFHRTELTYEETVHWFERNWRELSDLTYSYEASLSREEVARLSFISESEPPMMTCRDVGLRTRAERLGEDH